MVPPRSGSGEYLKQFPYVTHAGGPHQRLRQRLCQCSLCRGTATTAWHPASRDRNPALHTPSTIFRSPHPSAAAAGQPPKDSPDSHPKTVLAQTPGEQVSCSVRQHPAVRTVPSVGSGGYQAPVYWKVICPGVGATYAWTASTTTVVSHEHGSGQARTSSCKAFIPRPVRIDKAMGICNVSGFVCRPR